SESPPPRAPARSERIPPVRPAAAREPAATPSGGVADARVVAIDPPTAPNLVLLSVGSDDKIVAGDRFVIRRGAEPVGEVVVETVLRDSCGCRVTSMKEGTTIQAGDDAMRR
ncbi:MAG: hypothetical protein ACAI25_12800, partial [Planctomycetota bacterium]